MKYANPPAGVIVGMAPPKVGPGLALWATAAIGAYLNLMVMLPTGWGV